MKNNSSLLILVLFLCSFSIQSKENNSIKPEVCTVTQFDDLYSSLPQEIKSKIAQLKTNNNNYISYFAKNNGEVSLKGKKDTISPILARTTFENIFATNSSEAQIPTNKNTNYELLASAKEKQSFSEIAFIDHNTVVTIAFSKQNATLLFIDISNNKMSVTSSINIPVDNIYNYKKNTSNKKELFYIDASTNKIIIPVNKGAASINKNGELAWKKSKSTTPGIWIITPTKNEDKKWAIAPSQIAVRYFSSENLISKGRNAFSIQTAHPDSKGNIWLSFTNGILGVLPIISANTYDTEIKLYNFNKDAAWYTAMKKNYSTLLYQDLKNSTEFIDADTANTQKIFNESPDAFTEKYLENARYRIYSTILSDKMSKFDSSEIYENSSELWQYVNLKLDNPLDRKKGKTVDYFGYKVKQFQTIQNSLTSGNDESIYVVTNLGLHKLVYNIKTNAITEKWALPYKNSFLKESDNKVASSLTTPTFLQDRNEIIFCDNDFPQINLMIIDAKTGVVMQKFPLFEYSVGSACNNAIAFADNTIFIGNTFGNGINGYPAKGIMKFYSTENGVWHTDLDWNRLQTNTLCNTAALKIALNDTKTMVYQSTEENQKSFQFSAIVINKADKFYPIKYSLQPDFSMVKNKKFNLNNNGSNYTFGPKKSLFIGTSYGLLKIISE